MGNSRMRLFATIVLASAVAFALGTGAFSSVSAERSVSVNVAGDDSALLSLAPHSGPNGQGAYSTLNNGQLVIEIDGTNTTGAGVNLNALTVIDAVFNITNQGSQSVGVWIVKSGDHPDLITFEDAADARFDNSSANATTIAPGDTIEVGITIDTRGASLSPGDTLLSSITISADADDA